MNDTDSKKLEEIRGRMKYHTGPEYFIYRADQAAEDIGILLSVIAEQDREIGRLREIIKAGEEIQQEIIEGAMHDLGDEVLKERSRAEKAEAELADFKKVYEAHSTEAERQIDELQARVKELEAGKEKG